MKIGEFAQKHDVTQHTIRHYIEMGLLVPEKRNSQYRFSEFDSNDLKIIMELKELEFSLNEVQTVLAYQRLSGANTDVFHRYYLSCLDDKKNNVETEIDKLEQIYNSIENKIQVLKSASVRETNILGFPLDAIGIICCPVCKQNLNVSNGMVEKNMLIEANIQCQCGYQSVIRKGIYIDETAVRTKLLNGKRIPTKEEYLENCSKDYVNYIYKGLATLIEYIEKHTKQPKYIMELHSCVGFFLQQYIDYLPKNSTYIVIEYDLDRIKQLKHNLEKYNQHKNFIFLCCDIERLPINNGALDLVIDFTTEMNDSTLKDWLLNNVLRYLKKDGILGANYSLIYDNNKDKKKLEKMLEDLGLETLEEIEMEFLSKNCETDIKSEEKNKLVYLGRISG
jgi:DNA-binding transcriptional MerR regulator/SAM-dependent methyltransferase